MTLHKYSGNGNDFLIFHAFGSAARNDMARELCDRKQGFGADGLVVLLPHPTYAYQWEFYNSDGSEAKMCGNASRCVAHYAFSQGLAPADHVFLSGAGAIEASVRNDLVKSNLGTAKFIDEFMLEIPPFVGKCFLMDTGVPHLVIFTNEERNVPEGKNGWLKELRNEYDANVNVACVKNDNLVRLATYERGVEDVTLACGTGAAAVFAVAVKLGTIGLCASFIPPSGEKLRLSLKGQEILCEGKVKHVGTCIPDQNKYE